MLPLRPDRLPDWDIAVRNLYFAYAGLHRGWDAREIGRHDFGTPHFSSVVGFGSCVGSCERRADRSEADVRLAAR
ncbi:protein of unknown function [Hyphomicrobium sp. MC1]|nr:protein of unknown function [Hyphomicrobium sp. MC1]